VNNAKDCRQNLRYSFDHMVIKRQAYHPRAFNEESNYTRDVRAAFLPILKGDTPIHVKIDNETGAV
jgi:hypothetical protein